MQQGRGPWGTIAVFSYLGSLILPAVTFGSGAVPGIFCVMLGWLDFVPWSANLALLVASIARTHGKHRTALAMSLLAVALGLTTLRDLARGIGLGAGFYAWIGSMLAVAIASSMSIIDVEPIAPARARERAQRPTVAA